MKEKILTVLKSNLLFSLALNAAAVVICVLLTSFVYNDSSDFFNSVHISQNHFYYGSEINYILATLIGSVQYVVDSFNCYVLALIGFSYAAFVSITFVLAEKYKKRKALIFASIINILFALNHYSQINSCKTAALMMLGGFLLVLDAIRNKRYTLPCWLGVLEIVFGSFLNFPYFFVSLGFAAAYFAADLIAKKKYRLDFRKLFWYFRPFVLMFILIAALCLGLFRFSYSVNQATPKAAEYYRYSELKRSIETQPFPEYGKNSQAFEAVGIDSEYEYDLLKNGYYDNDKSLNIKALELVSDLQQKNTEKTPLYTITSIFTDLGEIFGTLSPTLIYVLLFFALSVLFVLYHRNRFIPFPCLYLAAIFISSSLIRYYQSGYDYLLYGIWLHAIVLLMYSFNYEYVRNIKEIKFFGLKHKYMVMSVIATVLLFAGYYTLYTMNLHYPSANRQSSRLITEISRTPDKYYVMDTATYNSFVKSTENYLHPLWGFRSGYLENLDTFGFFHNDEALRKRRTSDNIYEAVLGKGKIYVIDKNFVFKKEKYLTENYTDEGKTAVYQQTKEVDDYKLYKVTVQ